ncbi:purine and uridine phosphorylase [Epithele typhae]|uniref:purine and uridine phosphorylase n=1 Tax=Epithele typhae TaxID=378194 RepID=UPI002007DCED|nr:purine and uridine phosphorylase [Epithele typhae]KAH9911571.1 purine and uridine phosphorylase [Epithele typhae]
MKVRLTDANFPRTADRRVYHLGIRPGEVANRIITLGSPSRAHGVASYLDPSPTPFVLSSERGFLTITGRYKAVPVSIVAIGMGHPNADFFVREVRECLSGDMVVIRRVRIRVFPPAAPADIVRRLGSCGGLRDFPVGTIVAPKGSIAVSRNYDFDFVAGGVTDGAAPYRLSKPVLADPALHDAVVSALHETKPAEITTPIVSDTLNASADSFYSSQGRQTSFPDHNEALIAQITGTHDDVATLEMETFHILHLAKCWVPDPEPAPVSAPAPPHHAATAPSIPPPAPPATQTAVPSPSSPVVIAGGSEEKRPRIRAASAQMVFASRTSRDFITPEDVAAREAWTGRAMLEALVRLELDPEMLHEESGSVWEVKGVDAVAR